MKNKRSKSLKFANIVLGITVIIFIFVIICLWYRSNSLQIPLNVKLVSLLTAGLMFPIFALFLHNNLKINIATTLLSTIIVAYSSELVLLTIHNYPLFGKDKRSKIEVILDLRSDGVDAWPHVHSYTFNESNGLLHKNKRIFPLGGISNKTIVYCNEGGPWIIFKTDEHGFNNPEGQYKKGAVKITLLGDSFALGSCVKPGKDIAGQLRKKGIESLNISNAANGPLLELAALKEYVEPMEPEVVLWLYYEGNDLMNLQDERKSPILLRYLDGTYSQNLLERQGEIDAALVEHVNSYSIIKGGVARKKRIFRSIKFWYLRQKLSSLILTFHNKSPAMVTKPKDNVGYKSQLTLFSEILVTASEQTSGWGGKLYFVYLPNQERYMGANNNGNFNNRDDVLEIVNRLGIPVIDFNKVLDKHPVPLSLLSPVRGVRGHYNPEGYELLSTFIINQLKNNKAFSSLSYEN
jgi:hypothetical protein